MEIDNRIHIYVGNLPFRMSSRELRSLFEEHGEVLFAKIVRDRETQRSKGFGFVEMAKEEEAQKAIEKMDKSIYKERELIVNKARPRPERQERPERKED